MVLYIRINSINYITWQVVCVASSLSSTGTYDSSRRNYELVDIELLYAVLCASTDPEYILKVCRAVYISAGFVLIRFAHGHCAQQGFAPGTCEHS